jgi:polysaccharide deacetylase family protein (PEP-CTERM system associated)
MEDTRILNALSFDIEEYFHAAVLKGAFGDTTWEMLPSTVRQNTGRLLDMLEQESVTGTFFMLGWVAERFPALVKQIASRGHEIACHGYSHELVFTQSPAVFREETLRAKHLLEDLTGAPVAGYRAASFSITRKSLWALDILAEAGFLYDSSIYPVMHDRYGITGAPRFPYRLKLDAGELVEFPPPTLRLFGMTLPAAGGGYFRLLPYAYSQLALRMLNSVERKPLMFYLHPWEIDSVQPRGKVSWPNRVRHYFNVERVEQRLRQLVRAARFGSVEQSLRSCTREGLPELSVRAFA